MHSPMSQRTVIAYFAKPSACRDAVHDLQRAGFVEADISTTFLREGAPSENKPQVKSAKQESEGAWDSVVSFLTAEPIFDVYNKENLGPESYRVVGFPCHGGYAYEQAQNQRHAADSAQGPEFFEQRLSRNEEGAILAVTAGDRTSEVEAILLAHHAELGQRNAANKGL